jgi:hypothetical protein
MTTIGNIEVKRSYEQHEATKIAGIDFNEGYAMEVTF